MKRIVLVMNNIIICRDPSIHITFKVPKDDFQDLLMNNWEEANLSSIGHDNKKEYQGVYSYKMEMYTYVFYHQSVEGYIEIDFQGRHPGNCRE